MAPWLIGSKIYRSLGSILSQLANGSKLDCRDEYQAKISFDSLAERILGDARDIATSQSHTDEFVLVMTPGVDEYHIKLVKCIGCKASKYDLQLVGPPGNTIKLRKLC